MLLFVLLFTNVYSECVSNAQCRSNDNCNSYCLNGKCMLNTTVLSCPSDQVCYENDGNCYSKCVQSQDCQKYSFLLHYPYTGICNVTSGKCSDCLSNEDCQPWSTLTCGASCYFNNVTRESLCYNGNVCKNKQKCFDNSTSIFTCISSSPYLNFSNTLLIYLPFLICMIF